MDRHSLTPNSRGIKTETLDQKDWYEHRDELEEGMVFINWQDQCVVLDRRVPGDGTKWYVGDVSQDMETVFYEDSTEEPGNLRYLISRM